MTAPVGLELLLDAVTEDPTRWDELANESTQPWRYYLDTWDDGSAATGTLARFPVDSDALGYAWHVDSDTWIPWHRAGYTVFLPGEMWGEVTDLDAAKSEVRRFCAEAKERWGHNQ